MNQAPLFEIRNTSTQTASVSKGSSPGLGENVEDKHVSGAYIRKSCDFCGARKRKCNGDGVNPCSRCEKKGRHCVYSMKRVTGPRRAIAKRDQLTSSSTVAFAQGTERSFKRCRFSASPATGMVGMRENAFLVDFFDCLGILPYTNERTVREGMIRVMLASNAGISSPLAEIVPGQELLERSGDSNNTHLIGVTACTFWSAVAVGGLLQGRSQSSVATYISNARAVLEYCTDAPVVETLRMWIELAYLYTFSGDKVNVCESALHVKELLHDLHADRSLGEVPEELGFIGHHVKCISIYAGHVPDAEDMISFCNESTSALPQVDEIRCTKDVSRFVTGTVNSWGRSLFEDCLAQQRGGAVSGAGQPSLTAGAAGQQGAPQPDEGGYPTKARQEASPKNFHHSPILRRDFLSHFEQLDQMLKQSPIIKGIVGLLVNNFLGMWLSTHNDVGGSLKRLSCCIDILTRYPGLCRMITGVHVIHLILALLAYEHAHELYEKLRCIYNPLRAEGALPFPPLEEWEGISTYCDHLHCRLVRWVTLGHYGIHFLEEFDIQMCYAFVDPMVSEWRGGAVQRDAPGLRLAVKRALSGEIIGREKQRACSASEEGVALEEVDWLDERADRVVLQKTLPSEQAPSGVTGVSSTLEHPKFVDQSEPWPSHVSGVPMSQEFGISVFSQGFQDETATAVMGLYAGLNAAGSEDVESSSDHSFYSGGSRWNSLADTGSTLPSLDGICKEKNADPLFADDWLTLADILSEL